MVQQPQRLYLQAMNDVLLAPQERMTMQTAVDGATLLQCACIARLIELYWSIANSLSLSHSV